MDESNTNLPLNTNESSLSSSPFSPGFSHTGAVENDLPPSPTLSAINSNEKLDDSLSMRNQNDEDLDYELGAKTPPSKYSTSTGKHLIHDILSIKKENAKDTDTQNEFIGSSFPFLDNNMMNDSQDSIINRNNPFGLFSALKSSDSALKSINRFQGLSSMTPGRAG
jgi:hypothetical protein